MCHASFYFMHSVLQQRETSKINELTNSRATLRTFQASHSQAHYDHRIATYC